MTILSPDINVRKLEAGVNFPIAANRLMW